MSKNVNTNPHYYLLLVADVLCNALETRKRGDRLTVHAVRVRVNPVAVPIPSTQMVTYPNGDYDMLWLLERQD